MVSDVYGGDDVMVTRGDKPSSGVECREAITHRIMCEWLLGNRISHLVFSQWRRMQSAVRHLCLCVSLEMTK